jgi:hypothetical protein
MTQNRITRASRLIQQNDEQINARMLLDDAGFDRLWNAVNELPEGNNYDMDQRRQRQHMFNREIRQRSGSEEGAR